MTFDGVRYNFMGICSYYMVQDPEFDIIANNIACGHGHASCTKSISFNYNNHFVTMDHNHVLTIDGNDITRLPYKQNGIQIFMVSSLFMKVKKL